MTELFQYRKTEDAINAASKYLIKQLDDSQGNLLLLLSGGSSLNAVREAFKSLKDETIRRINVAQVDERLIGEGEVNNWQQIEEALGGKLARTNAQLAILADDDPDDAAISYEMELRSLLETADEVIGVYGVGDDGRLGGMLPVKDPEDFTQFLDGRICIAYEAPDCVRVTTTAALLSRLDEAVVFATGPDKLKMIERIEKDLPTHRHPAQLLKDAKRVSLFVGEELA